MDSKPECLYMDSKPECLYEEYASVHGDPDKSADFHAVSTRLWLYRGSETAPSVAVCLVTNPHTGADQPWEIREKWSEILDQDSSKAQLIRRAIAAHDAVVSGLKGKKA